MKGPRRGRGPSREAESPQSARAAAKAEVLALEAVALRPIVATLGQAAAVVPTLITLGSDCAGLGTERFALHLLGVKVKAVFTTEQDEVVRMLYRHLHDKKERIDHDVCSAALPARPAVDLYIAGPPCQSWSVQGKRMGLDDIRGRGLVFYHCLKYVREMRPRVVVFENVMGLRTQHVTEFRDILHILGALGYNVSWDALNSYDSGLPQSRTRVYIVAIRGDAQREPFTFPCKLRVHPPIQKFLEQGPVRGQATMGKSLSVKRNLDEGFRVLKERGVDPCKKACLIDVYASQRFAQVQVGVCPCITKTRAAQGGFYVTHKHRMTTARELGRMQGWPTSTIDHLLKHGATIPKVAGCIGNGMSVNVILRLLPRVLRAAGLINTNVADPWKHLSLKEYQGMSQLPDDVYRRMTASPKVCQA